MHVEDGLPGERGRFLVTHVGQNRVHGRMIRRDNDHPSRTVPRCPRWTASSPCRLMHLEPGAQLEHKRQQVLRAFENVGLPPSVVHPTMPAPGDLHWRARATYVVARHGERFLLGAYRRGTHVVQDMAGCPLEEPAIAAASDALVRAIEEVEPPLAYPDVQTAYDSGCGSPTSPRQFDDWVKSLETRRAPQVVGAGLRYVALRASSTGFVTALLLGADTPVESAVAIARRARENFAGFSGIYLGPSGRGDTMMGNGALVELGECRPLLDCVDEFEVEISPRSFFQVHRAAAAGLHRVAAERAVGSRIVELYSGVGLLSLRLAKGGAKVTAIESAPEACRDAVRNADRAGLSQEIRTVSGDAAEEAGRLAPGAFDSVVLNPPRKGCSAQVLSAVERLEPRRIIYVSCNPRTLARDLVALDSTKWRLTDAIPADLFPHSEHVECLAVMDRHDASGDGF